MAHRTPEFEESLAFLRRFAVIALLGLIGVAALVPGVLDSIDEIGLQNLPDFPVPVLTLLSIINPAFLVIAAAAVGALVAPRVGLGSLLADRAGRVGDTGDEPAATDKTPGIGVALLAGVAAGLLLMAAGTLAPFPAQLAAAPEAGAGFRDALLNALYGGLGEEVIARWGLLTLLAWAFNRFRNTGTIEASRMWPAILVTALLFGIFQLPTTMGAAPLTAGLVGWTVALNGLTGVLYGWLYWRHSLEAAMVAHFVTLLFFPVASLLGLA